MARTTKLNTAGCCDGTGQVHMSATDDPEYVGPLSYVAQCTDPGCPADHGAWRVADRRRPGGGVTMSGGEHAFWISLIVISVLVFWVIVPAVVR